MGATCSRHIVRTSVCPGLNIAMVNPQMHLFADICFYQNTYSNKGHQRWSNHHNNFSNIDISIQDQTWNHLNRQVLFMISWDTKLFPSSSDKKMAFMIWIFKRSPKNMENRLRCDLMNIEAGEHFLLIFFRSSPRGKYRGVHSKPAQQTRRPKNNPWPGTSNVCVYFFDFFQLLDPGVWKFSWVWTFFRWIPGD